jgi:hypothetical protein
MLTLPEVIMTILTPFATLFSAQDLDEGPSVAYGNDSDAWQKDGNLSAASNGSER